MTQAEAEAAIRKLARDWSGELPEGERAHPSFATFRHWLHLKGYSHYLEFRATIGAQNLAEQWFDHELGQAWRN